MIKYQTLFFFYKIHETQFIFQRKTLHDNFLKLITENFLDFIFFRVILFYKKKIYPTIQVQERSQLMDAKKDDKRTKSAWASEPAISHSDAHLTFIYFYLFILFFI